MGIRQLHFSSFAVHALTFSGFSACDNNCVQASHYILRSQDFKKKARKFLIESLFLPPDKIISPPFCPGYFFGFLFYKPHTISLAVA